MDIDVDAVIHHGTKVPGTNSDVLYGGAMSFIK